MFGLLPKSVWERHYPCDTDNMCPLAMRTLLIETDNKKILFDPGIGNNPDALIPAYGFNKLNDIVSQLNIYNIATTDITDIVLTHLHFDHSAAICEYDENGNISEIFPNAVYHIGKSQFKHSLNTTILDYDAYLPNYISMLSQNERVNLIDNEYFISENIQLRTFDGHTPGQLTAFIDDENQKYIFASDVLPISLNIRIESISAFDLNALESANTKLEVLNIAAKNNSLIYLYHDALYHSIRVKKRGDRFLISKE